jgi:anti-sigma28 factor (negative regulator of flagellin synthesis)
MEIRSNSFEPLRRGANPADITRPNRETIDKSTPEPRSPEDVRAHLAEERREADLRSQRLQAAREKRADRVHNARDKRIERFGNALAKHSGQEEAPAATPQRSDSIDIEDGIASKAERAHRARDKRFDRIANAREKVLERMGSTSDKVSLSETTLRLRADIEPADPTRAGRLAELRSQVQQGTLNTDELIARAAFKLLSGE